MPEYDATFGDERVNDSVDDRSVPELNNKDKVLLRWGNMCRRCQIVGT
jgi:hypothetical protein